MIKTSGAFAQDYFEKEAWSKNFFVCGVDEAGRGALAGPVVVAAVILPVNFQTRFQDSKKLSTLQREKQFELIRKHATISVTQASNQIIDKVNIYQATRLLMQQAVITALTLHKSKNPVTYVLTDAMPLDIRLKEDSQKIEYFSAPYGESWSTTIAAASIIAKVTRDRIMTQYHRYFPSFNFAQHKAYGTQQHQNTIEKYGRSCLHRDSFVIKKMQITPPGNDSKNKKITDSCERNDAQNHDHTQRSLF